MQVLSHGPTNKTTVTRFNVLQGVRCNLQLSGRLVFKISLENQNTYCVKCNEKIAFGFQDDLLFLRLVLNTKMHIALLALTNLSFFQHNLCSLGLIGNQLWSL